MRQMHAQKQLAVWIVSAALVVLAAAPNTAQAQRGRGGPGRGMFGGGGGLAGDVVRPDVREEVGITEDQQEQIRQLIEKQNEGAEAFRDLQRRVFLVPEDERAALRQELRQLQDQRDEELKEQLGEVLSDEQVTRVEQLSLHRAGTEALLRPSVSEDLELSDSQQERLAELVAERDAARAAMGPQAFRMSEEDQQKFKDEWDGKFLAVLTSAQRTQWTEKLGDPPAERGESGSSAPAVARTVTAPTTAPAYNRGTPYIVEKPADAVAVASFALQGQTEGAAGEESSGKMSFNFEYAQWKDVIEKFAAAAGLDLHWKALPPGTFNYRDDDSYTPTEALDIINGYLLQEGFILVRRDGFLVVINIDDGIPPNLIPVITADELPRRGKNELLTVTFPVPSGDAAKLADQVQQLLGPQGKAAGIPETRTLSVTDIGSNLRRVKSILDGTGVPGAETVSIRGYPLKHVAAVDAENLVRSLLGIGTAVRSVASQRGGFDFRGGDFRGGDPRGGDPRGGDRGGDARTSSSTQSSSLISNEYLTRSHVASDPRTNQLLVTAPELVHKMVEGALLTIDVEPPPGGNFPVGSNRRYLQVYTVRTADADDVGRTIDAIMPGVFINSDDDGPGGRVHIMGTSDQHREVEGLIRQLDGLGSAGSVAVIPLASMDPVTAAATLRSMFIRDGTDAPTIEADLYGRQIMIRGSAEQITQIRTLLTSLGEDGNGRRLRGDGSTLRRVPLSGRDPNQLLDLLQRAWSDPAPIRVVPARERNPVRDMRMPGRLPTEVERQPEATPTSTRTDAHDAVPARGVPVQTVSVESEPREAGGRSASTDDAAESEETRKPSRGALPDDISIQVIGDELVITGGDPEALDRLQSVLDRAMQVVQPEAGWTVYTLQAYDCLEAATMLQQLIPDTTVASTSTTSSSSLFGGLTSGISQFGSSVMDMTGLNGTTLTTLRIIPDPSKNALWVAGPASKVQEVERLLEVLDASEWPGNLRERLPRMIPVEHADVTEVYRQVRELYADYLENERNRNDRNNPFAAMFGGGGSSRGGNDRRQQQEVRLTISVDEQTSNLMVSANDSLYNEIKTFVASIDQKALEGRRTIRVVSLQNASSTAVQSMLGSLMPKVKVSSARTSPTSGDRPSGSSSGGDFRPSWGGPGGDGDAMRRMMEFRQMQEMQQRSGSSGIGGDRGGSSRFGSGFPGGGGGGFPGGSFGSRGSFGDRGFGGDRGGYRDRGR